MKDGCVYCSESYGLEQHYLINEFPLIKITKPFKGEITAYVEIYDNNLHLCCYTNDDDRTLATKKIKYCPMCGRKLKEVVE